MFVGILSVTSSRDRDKQVLLCIYKGFFKYRRMFDISLTLISIAITRFLGTRAAVHITGRGRRGEGSSAREAALAVMSPARIAAFSAARSVARMRARVAAVTGRPSASCWRTIAVNIASTCRALTSASRIRPRHGLR